MFLARQTLAKPTEENSMGLLISLALAGNQCQLWKYPYESHEDEYRTLSSRISIGAEWECREGQFREWRG